MGSRAYDKYTFVNTSHSKPCVTVTYTATGPCPGHGALGVAYSQFNPADPSQHYLADGAFSVLDGIGNTGPRSFSFKAKKHAAFDIVVSAVDVAGTCDYSLSVSGKHVVNVLIPPLLADLESLVPGLHAHDLYHDVLNRVHALQAAADVSNGAACAALGDLWSFVAAHASSFSATGYAAFVNDLSKLSALLGC